MLTKKMLRNWTLISLVLVGLIYFLMLTGKEHSLFLDNRGGESGIRYSINGENYQDLGIKKIQRFVKGSSQTIYFKKKTGELVEYDVSFAFREEEKELKVKDLL